MSNRPSPCSGDMRDRARQGATVLVSSHDLGLLERFCDDVLFIHNGTLIAHDSMPAFLRRFAPSDAVTLRLDSDITPEILDRIRRFNPRQNAGSSLVVSIPEDASLGDLVAVLEPDVRVLDASRETASLRDIYLEMTTRKGVEV